MKQKNSSTKICHTLSRTVGPVFIRQDSFCLRKSNLDTLITFDLWGTKWLGLSHKLHIIFHQINECNCCYYPRKPPQKEVGNTILCQSAFYYEINEFEAYQEAYHVYITTRCMVCDLWFYYNRFTTVGSVWLVIMLSYMFYCWSFSILYKINLTIGQV